MAAAQPTRRIFVYDEQVAVREGLRRLFDRTAAIKIVGDAGTLPELLARLERKSCDVLVLEPMVDGQRDIGVLQQVHANFPEARILVYSSHAAVPFIAGDDTGGQQRLRATERIERASLDVLHREVQRSTGFAGIEHRDDPGVEELAGRARFAQEPLAGLVSIALRQGGEAVEDLDRDPAIDLGVVRQEDAAHRATPVGDTRGSRLTRRRGAVESGRGLART